MVSKEKALPKTQGKPLFELWAEEEVTANEMRRTARPKPNKNYSGGVNLERYFLSISRGMKTAWLQRKMEKLKMITMLSVVGGSGEWNYIDIHCSAWKRWCWGPDWGKIIIYALGLFCLQ